MTVRRAVLVLLGSLSISLGAAFAAAPPTPDQLRDFFRAVQMDDPGTVKSLLGGAVNPNQAASAGGEPPLVLAVREGSMRVFELLLNHPGTRVDAQAANGNTALMMAAFKNNLPAAKALLAKGATVNLPGWTPLHYAAASGDVEIARLLLARGAHVDAISPPASGSYTPLMMAAREGHPDMVDFLAGQGANPALRNSEGLTAAQIADRAGGR